jgi:serine/threonine-protein phosphatase 2A regulatory subunit A
MEALELLQEELAEHDIVKRRDSFKRLTDVARALGPADTRSKLVPFLAERLDDDDEVLFQLATQLGALGELVGGAEHGACLLPTLEQLCQVEETVVRDAAVQSICTLVATFPEPVAQGSAVPLVTRLANGDWFTSKVSSCGLVATCYSKATAAGKQQLITLFCNQLAKDDTPMVRRAVAKQIGAVCAVADSQEQLAKVVPLYKELAMDDQNESVRLLALERSAQMAESLKNVNPILDVVKPQFQELSWRVRNSVVKNFGALARACGPEITNAQLCPLLPPLLVDPEAEVRLTICGQLVEVCNIVGAAEFRNTCMSSLMALVEQPEEDPRIRAGAANAIMHAAPKLGTDFLSSDKVMPFVKKLVNQPQNPSEVTVKVLPHLAELIETLDSDGVQNFCKDVLLKMMNADPQTGFDWRARSAAAEALPVTARQLQKSNISPETFFEKNKVFDAFFELLNDRVCNVREAAALSIGELNTVLGTEWTTSTALPYIAQFTQDTSYLRRSAAMKAVKALAKDSGLTLSCLRLFQVGLQDKICNVRIAALRGLAESYDDLRMGNTEEIVSTVNKLVNDEDSDVRNYAAAMVDRL